MNHEHVYIRHSYLAWLFLLFSLWIIGGCSSDDDTPQSEPVKNEITLTINSIDVSAEGKTTSIVFSANTQWIAKSDQNWCSVSPDSGDGGTHTLAISVKENTTENERKATVTLKAGTATQAVTVTQKPKEKDLLTISQQQVTAEAKGTDVTLQLNASTQWTAKSDQDWCGVTPASGVRGTHTLTITVKENTTENERKATVTLKAGTATQAVTVIQKPKEKDLLTLSQQQVTAEAKGADVTLQLNASTQWTAKSDHDWCSVSPDSGDGGTHTLTITVKENTTENKRKATVTLKAGTATQTVTVTQKPKEILLAEKTLYEVGATDGTLTVNINSNTPYTVSVTENWVKLTQNNPQKLTFHIEENPQTAIRTATVTLKGTTTQFTFTIRQASKQPGGSNIEDMPNQKW